MRSCSFLVVSLEGFVDGPLVAGCEVFNINGAIEIWQSFYEGQFVAIGRGRRSDRSAGPACKGFRLTCGELKAFDGKNFSCRVFTVLPNPP